MAAASFVNLPSDECHWTLVMISQRWFRKWLGADRHQAITRANVDWDQCCHMVSLGPNELTHCDLMTVWGYRFLSTLTQVMACCLTATSHYLNQCWLTITMFCGIHLTAISQVFINLICEKSLKIIFLKLLPNLPVHNELTHCGHNKMT